MWYFTSTRRPSPSRRFGLEPHAVAGRTLDNLDLRQHLLRIFVRHRAGGAFGHHLDLGAAEPVTSMRPLALTISTSPVAAIV